MIGPLRTCLLLAVPMLVAATLAATAAAQRPLPLLDPPPSPALQDDDVLALVGGTLVERMQYHGHLEAQLQCARPQLRLRVRNLGWSGDDVHGTARAGFDPPAAGYDRLMRDLQTAGATVALVAYGFAEASSAAPAIADAPSPSGDAAADGGDAADGGAADGGQRFQAGLRRLVEDLRRQQIRVLLLRPFPLPGVKTPGYARAMQRCRQAVDAVAARLGVPVLEASLDPADPRLFTFDGMNPSPAGYARMADQLAPELAGAAAAAAAACAPERLSALRQRIADKNQLFFHRYRPQNETYLFLFRKHEQGNNAAEIPRFDPLVEQADEAIWRLANNKNPNDQ